MKTVELFCLVGERRVGCWDFNLASIVFVGLRTCLGVGLQFLLGMLGPLGCWDLW